MLFVQLQVKSRSNVNTRDVIVALLIHQIERNIRTYIHLINRTIVECQAAINRTHIHHR